MAHHLFVMNLPDPRVFYQEAYRARCFDQAAFQLQRTGNLGTFPSSRGQETCFITWGLALTSEDIYCPYYRDHGALLVRGTTALTLLSYWGGYVGSTHSTTHPKDLSICIPIATQCTHAVGLAYAKYYCQDEGIILCSLGDGATAKGDFYEALNAAAIHQLPIVFHINNNQWAISTPLSEQTATPLYKKAAAFGLKSRQISHTDPQIMYETYRWARENTPCLIETITHRLDDHTTADDQTRYREETELDALKDPLPALRTWAGQYHPESSLCDDESAIQHEINDAVKAYTARQQSSSTFQAIRYHHEYTD